MTRRWLGTAILAGLVATPAVDLYAQSNPWYIPPQPQQPTYSSSGAAVQGMPQHLPQTYTQAPQYGFGTGYVVQQQAPSVILVPAQPAPAPLGQIQQPTTTGAIGSNAYAAPTPSTAYPQTYQAPAVTTHQAPQTYQLPSYSSQQPQYVPQPQVQVAPGYQQPPLVFGAYPPLGSDPTQPPAAAAQPQATPAPPSSPLALTPIAPATGTAGTLLHPGFTGPTTLTPGFGAYPGLSPIYPAPLGASPYLGLPFY